MQMFVDPTLGAALTSNSELVKQLMLLEQLPTVARIGVYSDIKEEPESIGIPKGVYVHTTGPDALVVPNAVADPNDGYRVFHLGLTAAQISGHHGEILGLLEGLRNPWPALSNSQLSDIMRGGLRAVDVLGLGAPPEAHLVHDAGHEPLAQPAAVPQRLRRLMLQGFGSYGTCRHFLEVFAAQEALPRFGIQAGDVLAVIHSGAMHAADELYLLAWDRFSELAAELGVVSDEHYLHGQFGLPLSHPVSQWYLQAAACISNVGYAWRWVVQARVVQLFERFKPRSTPRLLYDAPHNWVSLRDDGVHHAKALQPLSGPPGQGAPRPYLLCGGLGVPSYLLDFRDSGRIGGLCGHGASCLDIEAGADSEAGASAQVLTTNQPQKVLRGQDRAKAITAAKLAVRSHANTGALERAVELRPLISFQGDRPSDGAGGPPTP